MIVAITLALLMIGHELGHAAVAALYHIPVRRIRIGIGPVLASATIGRTQLMLCLVPWLVSFGYARSDIRTREQDAWIAAGGLISTEMMLAPLFYMAVRVGSMIMGITIVAFVLVLMVNLIPFRGTDCWRIVADRI